MEQDIIKLIQCLGSGSVGSAKFLHPDPQKYADPRIQSKILQKNFFTPKTKI